MWTKYPEEVTLESTDFTALLRGDTIVGAPTFEVGGNLTCTVTQVAADTVRISGGSGGESGYVIATINTVGGQLLRPQYRIKILNRPTVVT